MKQRIMMYVLCLFMTKVCNSQYTYFNQSHVSSNWNPNIAADQIDTIQGSYYGFGHSFLGWEWFKVNLAGDLLENDNNDFFLNYSYGSLSAIRDGFVRTPDGGFITSIVDFTNLAGWAKLDSNLELDWYQLNPNNISDSLGLIMRALCTVNDTCFGAFVGSITGFRIGRMKYSNGELIELYELPIQGFSNLQNFRYFNNYYYLLGAVYNSGPNQGQFPDEQTRLLKVSLQGVVVGELILGNPDDCREQWPQMELTPDGKFLLMYELCSEEIEPFLNESYRKSTAHWAVINPEDLSIIDSSEYDFPHTAFWGGGVKNYCIYTDAQNNVISISGIGITLDDPPSMENIELHAAIITKFDADKNIEWQQEYYSPETNEEDLNWETLSDMVQTEDGGYMCVGEINGVSFQKLWLLKIDACGYEQPSGCPPVVSVEEQPQRNMYVWPNPFLTQIKAVLPNDAKKISIIDATGRVVYEENIFYPNQTWNLSSLSVGVYVMSVQMENGMTLSERIVKR